MNYIKHSSIKFLQRNHLLGKEVTLERLLKASRQNGYIVKYYSTANMQLVLLDLYDRAKKSSSVSCKDENGNVCIFIDDSMSDDEQLFALAHEIGHIILEHKPVENKKLKGKQEREANLFAHHLITKTSPQKISNAINTVLGILIFCALGIMLVVMSSPNKEEVQTVNYHYTQAEKSGEVQQITDSTVCYLARYSTVYHTYRDCSYLKNSETVFESTVGKCGKDRQCSRCAARYKE